MTEPSARPRPLLDAVARAAVTVLAVAVVWTQHLPGIEARFAVSGLLTALAVAVVVVRGRSARTAVAGQAMVVALVSAGAFDADPALVTATLLIALAPVVAVVRGRRSRDR